MPRPSIKECVVRAFAIYAEQLRHDGHTERTILRAVMYLAAESMAVSQAAPAIDALVRAVEIDLRERLGEYEDCDDELPRC